MCVLCVCVVCVCVCVLCMLCVLCVLCGACYVVRAARCVYALCVSGCVCVEYLSTKVFAQLNFS